jgi:Spy/CpxP family protein refolding chaperone
LGVLIEVFAEKGGEGVRGWLVSQVVNLTRCLQLVVKWGVQQCLMKKLIVSLAIVAFATATGLAQAQDDKPKRPAGAGGGAARFSPEERLKMLTASLGLDQDQQDKIKKIMEESRPEMEKARALPQEERRAKLREITRAQNDKIVAVLTPEQKEKYKTAMANRQNQGGGDANAPKKEGDKAADESKK